MLWLALALAAAQPAPASQNYLGSAACAQCHAAEATAWSGSHHALAMREADASTVLGNFNDASFSQAGMATHFSRRDGRFVVRTDGPDGKLADYPVTYTFGVDPLQQYLVAFPGGIYQALSIAWDSRAREDGGQRWFHLYPDERIDFKDPLHWTGPYQRWNSRCAECHSTAVEKRFDPATRTYATRWAEVSVGCESCHGGGRAHADGARKGLRVALPVNPGGAGSWRFAPDAAIAHRIGESTQAAQLDVCSSCHARRQNIGVPEPGQPFLDRHLPSLLDTGLYHPDGQILDEVFEHGSFLQSRMAQRGVSCGDCHEPHSARLRAEGNAVCAQCHQPARYDAPAHHRHPAGSAGAACASCHMPPRNYMVVDPRHDHRFGIPDPWLSVGTQTPNACTACHAERDAAWAVSAVEGWGYQRRPDAPGSLLARSRAPTLDGVTAGRRLAGDASMPPMQRATAMAELRVVAARDLDLLAAGLRDPEPLVRLGAARAVANVPPEYAQALLWPLLKDPFRAVRLEAVRPLAALPAGQLSAAQRGERDAVVAEYLAAQEAAGDLAGGPLNRAGIYLATGRVAQAETAYREALALEPHLVPAWLNLADLYRATGREEQAAEALERALAIAPGEASVRHARGLYLVRAGRRDEALKELQEAQRLAPGDARYAYVLAVALHSAGRSAEAVTVARQASERSPVDAALLQLLVSIYRDSGQVAESAAASRRLLELNQALAR